jgi:drug/metabolite transporter (DMT)-like permease
VTGGAVGARRRHLCRCTHPRVPHGAERDGFGRQDRAAPSSGLSRPKQAGFDADEVAAVDRTYFLLEIARRWPSASELRWDVMGRTSGHVDGLMSGATWGVVAVLLPGSDQLPGASLLAMSVAVSTLFDTAAAFFLLVRSGVAGSLADVVRVLTSKRALAVGVCSVLGGPLFMGGYIAAVILAGPSEALTATATYPMIGAILARFFLRQRLDRVGWLGVTVTVLGTALIAVDASGADNNGQVLIGVGVAVAAATAVALEGIVATRAMVGLDTNTVMAVRELLSAGMFGLVLLAVPGGIAAAGSVIANTGLIVPIICAGMIGGYSYAIWYRSIRKIGVARAMALNISYAVWGAIFAWSLLQAPLTLFAITGCAVVTGGAVLTIFSGRLEPACVSSKSASPLPGSTEAPETLSTSSDPEMPASPVANGLPPPQVVDRARSRA